ncbi:hypothetical protein BCR33DRAFT_720403 [Rhizoclosmatium globosum]|uniref:Uncharacterized protein n=1 Tax=Rhizoclosmatium globosum TaxID=329046 RepID=A0A1Y2BWM5_9FUNG|nr:hypothetical protein BCR33DRAFT_720403 [Rhizoclosmatium globosum]|eukprot:ORY39170.1 hypothetical protein BCR33DRAFT_720403 [Rhizoclosmatium globosum]
MALMAIYHQGTTPMVVISPPSEVDCPRDESGPSSAHNTGYHSHTTPISPTFLRTLPSRSSPLRYVLPSPEPRVPGPPTNYPDSWTNNGDSHVSPSPSSPTTSDGQSIYARTLGPQLSDKDVELLSIAELEDMARTRHVEMKRRGVLQQSHEDMMKQWRYEAQKRT